MCQHLIARFCVIALAIACVAAKPIESPRVAHWQVVLVAGDTAQPVFDNAVKAMDMWLVGHGVAQGDIHRLAASAGPRDPSIEPATLERVLGRIAALHAGAGDGCFVFITSHGAHGGGVYLSRRDQLLDPAPLARALSAGCGASPTIVVVSACYSGSFARGVAAPNRVILTAARADRPSFGCAADRTYTDYDACLLGALPHAETWRGVFDDTRGCVERRERQEDDLPSHPQASFGSAVRKLALQF